MNFSDYMFYQESSNDFTLFSVEHLLALAIIASLAMALILYHKKIQAWSYAGKRRLEIGAGVILLLPRIGLYVYYLVFGISFNEILPLYICRITIIAILYSLFTGNRNLRFLIYYFGIFFGVIPLILVDTSGYTFPHAMYFSFFVGHGMILLVNLYFLIVEGYRPGFHDFKMATKAMAIYFLVAAIANPLFQGNYNYLEVAPPIVQLGSFNGTLAYKAIVVGVFMIVLVAEYLPFARSAEKNCLRTDMGRD